MNIIITQKQFQEEFHEFVERKGIGHPDTLSDALAEDLSVKYSLYTKEKYGAVLHHNFDKVGLLGGSSHVSFGRGYLVNPIRVLLNGRASTKFGEESIPVYELLISWTKDFFADRFPMIDVDKDLKFHYNLSNHSSPGKTEESSTTNGMRKFWFEPRSLDDIQELKSLVSNDTSLGVGYFPCSRLENLVWVIENTLNSPSFKQNKPWLGSDIKIMGFRRGDTFHLTMAIPQIADHVKSINEYKENLIVTQETVHNIAKELGISDIELSINTRDNFNSVELYLTAIGSSIESGDEGLVGRGNRINGLISPSRPISMEGACGKNPVYHIGKIYYIAAQELSKQVYEKFNAQNEIYIVSQSGRALTDPWNICVVVDESFKSLDSLQDYVKENIERIPMLTDGILARKYGLF